VITIVHKIRLKPGTTCQRFESWVQEVDYRTCPELESVHDFAVHRVTSDAGAHFHYFEVIRVRDRASFARDMSTPSFGRLVNAFSEMAEVVETLDGQMLEPGYTYSGGPQ
jgi:hypothetical protein